MTIVLSDKTRNS